MRCVHPARPVGFSTTARAQMLKPVRRFPTASLPSSQSGVRDLKWTYETARHCPKAWSSSERKIACSANKMMGLWLSSCLRCATSPLQPARPPAHRLFTRAGEPPCK